MNIYTKYYIMFHFFLWQPVMSSKCICVTEVTDSGRESQTSALETVKSKLCHDIIIIIIIMQRLTCRVGHKDDELQVQAWWMILALCMKLCAL